MKNFLYIYILLSVQAFTPFIITKDMISKKVYGAGYPSRPVLTVEEFYEERVRDGIWQPPGSR